VAASNADTEAKRQCCRCVCGITWLAEWLTHCLSASEHWALSSEPTKTSHEGWLPHCVCLASKWAGCAAERWLASVRPGTQGVRCTALAGPATHDDGALTQQAGMRHSRPTAKRLPLHCRRVWQGIHSKRLRPAAAARVCSSRWDQWRAPAVCALPRWASGATAVALVMPCSMQHHAALAQDSWLHGR
jgi:hypothetical protein